MKKRVTIATVYKHTTNLYHSCNISNKFTIIVIKSRLTRKGDFVHSELLSESITFQLIHQPPHSAWGTGYMASCTQINLLTNSLVHVNLRNVISNILFKIFAKNSMFNQALGDSVFDRLKYSGFFRPYQTWDIQEDFMTHFQWFFLAQIAKSSHTLSLCILNVSLVCDVVRPILFTKNIKNNKDKALQLGVRVKENQKETSAGGIIITR
ncbi:hypothetical protein PHYBLDRAFT_164906 [Phycomyces blakesleeanus NRRL 1555(-)]|uniref:Uncharacterized protein n=1 Tax=Phycomyces blakesleeanus (strain ATCC 8743b / DSM 1359 / FGSC 10004 / NBRC 33097 / NRRL 1555) TaxID=763407 RepID=A0A162UU69_PHYB8|nr:hypothetical protein PHYBLDRAFT_164906 [Phycomyces blakesleeanus NRRL 1555(-)]OAD78023.1 hypothetical protein PHYBLDRAFT_164906 [Phycomyces blakesleeanus NRRL 1555(-)]|eukprot:XP_018296063.1 hypothetical protein PHYBLDRAFT_164906 [Phycomyces blakesleeanus NRRL 1555(-)]